MQLLSMMLDVRPQQSFETLFWPPYPRKEKKKDAEKAWAVLLPDDAIIQEILAALGWQIHLSGWQRGYIPLPGSYIRGARWKDAPPARVARVLSESRAALPTTDADREHQWRVQQSMAERNRLDLLDAEKRRAEYFRTHPWAIR